MTAETQARIAAAVDQLADHAPQNDKQLANAIRFLARTALTDLNRIADALDSLADRHGAK